jgi:hypothetical protein
VSQIPTISVLGVLHSSLKTCCSAEARETTDYH